MGEFVRIIRWYVAEKDAVRFGIVGALGFVVNLTVLTLLYKVLSISLLPAQVLGAETAIIFNYVLHNNWTYRQYSKKSLWRRFGEFQLSSLSGSLITTLILLFLTRVFHLNYIVALAIGGGVAMIWNFLWTKYVVWRTDPAARQDARL